LIKSSYTVVHESLSCRRHRVDLFLRERTREITMDDDHKDKNGMVADFQVIVSYAVVFFELTFSRGWGVHDLRIHCLVLFVCVFVIQAITGIDNAAEALMHLSNFDWDLLVCITFIRSPCNLLSNLISS